MPNTFRTSNCSVCHPQENGLAFGDPQHAATLATILDVVRGYPRRGVFANCGGYAPRDWGQTLRDHDITRGEDGTSTYPLPANAWPLLCDHLAVEIREVSSEGWCGAVGSETSRVQILAPSSLQDLTSTIWDRCVGRALVVSTSMGRACLRAFLSIPQSEPHWRDNPWPDELPGGPLDPGKLISGLHHLLQTGEHEFMWWPAPYVFRQAGEGALAFFFSGIPRSDWRSFPDVKNRSDMQGFFTNVPGAAMFLAHATRQPVEGNEVVRLFLNAVTANTSQYGHRDFELLKELNTIGELAYEGRPARGGILLAPDDACDVVCLLVLRGKPRLRDHRMTRKLLEMAHDGFELLSDGLSIRGFGRLRAKSAGRSPWSRVEFLGRGRWEFQRSDGVALFGFEHGRPRPPGIEGPLVQVRSWLRSQGVDARAAPILKAIRAASNSHHGALLIVATDAESEAARLQGGGQLVEPVLVTPALVRAASSIDGAILLDTDGVCHAIGMILDGQSQTGDPRRGARYNSAKRYVASGASARRLAVVVSEDGMIDVCATSTQRRRARHV